MYNAYIYPISVSGVTWIRLFDVREQGLNIPETGYLKLFRFLFNDFPAR